jgi:hypothetical protein
VNTNGGVTLEILTGTLYRLPGVSMGKQALQIACMRSLSWVYRKRYISVRSYAERVASCTHALSELDSSARHAPGENHAR